MRKQKAARLLAGILSTVIAVLPAVPSVPAAAAETTKTLSFVVGDVTLEGGTLQGQTNPDSHYSDLIYSDDNNDGKITVPNPFSYENDTYKPVKTGYTFKGWKRQGSNTIETIDEGGSKTFTLDAAETIYYAQWEGPKYQVTFSGVKEGTAAVTKELELGADNDISVDTIVKSGVAVDGYDSSTQTITGWQYSYTEDGQTKTVFFDGSSSVVHTLLASNGEAVLKSDSVTLTPVIVKKGVSVTFDPNTTKGGSGTAASVNLAIGKVATLPSQNGGTVVSDGNVTASFSFTNAASGTRFLGWDTDKDASTPKYLAGQQSVTNFNFATDTTLYAIWGAATRAASSVTIQFVENYCYDAGTATSYTNKAPLTLFSGEEPVQLYSQVVASTVNKTKIWDSDNLPAQAGYFVDYWELTDSDGNAIHTQHFPRNAFIQYTGGNVEISSADQISKVTISTGSSTIYLKPVWKKITVKLAYNGNGGSGTASSNAVFAIGDTYALEANPYSKAGKDFMGWGSVNNQNVEDAKAPGYIVNSVLKASSSGETLFSDNYSKYLDMGKWMAAGLQINAQIFDLESGTLNLTKTSSANIVAVWSNDTYTIKFDRNEGTLAGGSGSMADETMPVSDNKALSENRFVLSGYSFDHWNTKADDTGVSFKDTEKVKGLAKRGETVTLYAQWKADALKLVPLTVQQVWEDKTNQDGIRPETTTYKLTASAGGTTLTAADLGIEALTFDVKSSDSSATLAQVPYQFLLNGSWEYVTYRLSTDAPKGYSYTTTYSGSSDGFNTVYKFAHTPESMNFTVNLGFQDDSNQDGLRPQSVTITLSGSDGSTSTVTVAVSGTTFSYVFENLPKYSKGKTVTYTAKLGDVTGYTSKVTNAANASTITASHKTEMLTTNIKIEWQDNDDKYKARPAMVKVSLSGSNNQSNTYTLVAASNWSTTTSNLPKYNMGSAVNYTCTVTPLTYYTSTITGDVNKGYTIVLKVSDIAAKTVTTPKVSDSAAKESSATTKKIEKRNEDDFRTITIKTIWNDNDQDYLRPLAMNVTLIGSDGETYNKILMSNTSYTATFSSLPKTDEDHKDID